MKTSNSQVNECCFLFKRKFVNVFTRDELGSMSGLFVLNCEEYPSLFMQILL